MPALEELLAPISEGTPAGADLRYDPIMDRIKEARRADIPGVGSSQGDGQSKTADWKAVRRLSEDVISKKSKDLQVAGWWTEAKVHLDGAAGLLAGLDLVHGLCTSFGTACYPRDPDGDPDVQAAPLSWLGGDSFAVTLRLALSITQRDRYTLETFRIAQQIGSESDASGNSDKTAARTKAQLDGLVLIERFDAAVAQSEKGWYRALLEQLSQIRARYDALGQYARVTYPGPDSPSFSSVRSVIEQAEIVAKDFLARKLVLDPDPVDPTADGSDEPAAEGMELAEPAPLAQVRGAAPARAPASGADAEMLLSSAAVWFRRDDPCCPTSYLLLRAWRWGELVGSAADDGTQVALDPRLLIAPPTPLRSKVKGLYLSGSWAELLETCETAMATPGGRGWIDLQRYVLTAVQELGPEYRNVGVSIRAALRALLAARPELPAMSLMDDSASASQETREWLAAEFAPGGTEVFADSPLPTPSIGTGSRAAFGRAKAESAAGDVQGAIAMMLGELGKERTPRGQFLRRVEIAKIMVDGGLAGVARPMLEELVQLIDSHRLAAWEAGGLVAQPLGLLYRVYRMLDTEDSTANDLYLRVCKLDPMLALALKPQ